ncbi:uncharacterized protein EV422DRAFT_586818 [Fimicolochytrium jonesii]|uniref:uncharacterized protein n=1 Tax=Fimicolochytrium jonesii TaxID=1396493 RepID=UPI0022FE79C6|nr:uncharacterized protein EV422DRAFT_586818 [Fimicolochytrium jonesii]KAI8821330.1 hypothetical protein EV422DRAFT_586818 [Fimicolochytrium jonesii]
MVRQIGYPPKSTFPKALTLQRRRGGYRSGELAEAEIKHYAHTYGSVILKSPFRKLIEEIDYEVSWAHNQSIATTPGATPFSERHRWYQEAVDALQETAETYISALFSDSIMQQRHAKRLTLNKDEVSTCLSFNAFQLPKLKITPFLTSPGRGTFKKPLIFSLACVPH